MNIETWTTLTTGIARELDALTGDGWHIVKDKTRPGTRDTPTMRGPYVWNDRIENGIGHRIHLHHGHTDGRLEISGDWPRLANGLYAANTYQGETNPHITVGLNRDPAAIAKDVVRRFLPNFSKRWAEVAERVLESDNYAANRQTMREELVGLIDGARLSTHSEEEVWATDLYRNIRVGSTVELQLWDLTMPLARQIIAVVEKWRAAHADEE